MAASLDRPNPRPPGVTWCPRPATGVSFTGGVLPGQVYATISRRPCTPVPCRPRNELLGLFIYLGWAAAGDPGAGACFYLFDGGGDGGSAPPPPFPPFRAKRTGALCRRAGRQRLQRRHPGPSLQDDPALPRPCKHAVIAPSPNVYLTVALGRRPRRVRRRQTAAWPWPAQRWTGGSLSSGVRMSAVMIPRRTPAHGAPAHVQRGGTRTGGLDVPEIKG